MSRSLYSTLHRRFGARDGFSRRDFLRGALAGSAALTLGACATKAPPAGRAHRTVIIGAGFAGLACAHELCGHGSRVTVVEARARVGGRVSSQRGLVPDKVAEGGAEFIGTNHPLWNQYAKRFELELFEAEEDESLELPIVLKNRRLSDAEARELYDAMSRAVAQLSEAAAPIDADQPWTSAGAHALDIERLSRRLVSLDADPLAKYAIAVQLCADNGVAVEMQSTLANLAMIKGGGLERFWTDSEVLRCRGGNQRLAEAFAEALGAEHLSLKRVVERVDCTRETVRVKCADGAELEADDVVLAIPPSTWSSIRFDPPLPDGLAPQMGRSVKYLAAVRRPYWKDAGLSPDALTDGDITYTWDATAGQSGGEGAVLTAFASARGAKRWGARTASERKRVCEFAFETLFPGFKEHAESARFMDWPRDPWARAGYSFPAPGEVTRFGPVLRQGVGRLHFAGEHTSTKFVGYMEGALESGVRVAREVSMREGWSTG